MCCIKSSDGDIKKEPKFKIRSSSVDDKRIFVLLLKEKDKQTVVLFVF